MKIREVTGDLFEAPQTVIGHGVNTEGVMGAGIAKVFRAKYPHMYEQYKRYCQSPGLWPGQATCHFVGDNKLVVNLASQDKPGRNARPQWIASALVSAAVSLSSTTMSLLVGSNREIAIPRIGCGIGGLTWDQVSYAIATCGWDNWTVVVYNLPEQMEMK